MRVDGPGRDEVGKLENWLVASRLMASAKWKRARGAGAQLRRILFGVERAVGREKRGGQVAELAAGHLLRVPPVVLPAISEQPVFSLRPHSQVTSTSISSLRYKITCQPEAQAHSPYDVHASRQKINLKIVPKH